MMTSTPDVGTRQQKLRGTRPDAASAQALYLIKNVSELRLTYQIRLLTYAAQQQGKVLIVQLPSEATIHPSLGEFVHRFPSLIKIEHN
jgi:hypothetical protein